MRPRPLFFVAMLLAVAACGGSSSETPWPAEPQGPALGPTEEGPKPTSPNDPPEAPQDDESPPERPGAGH
jgi:hypothetical protein